MFHVLFFFNLFSFLQDETVAEIITSVTGAMTTVIGAAVIATIAIAGITLAMAWGGLRKVLRLGGR